MPPKYVGFMSTLPKTIPEEIRKNDLSRQKARTLVENQYGKDI